MKNRTRIEREHRGKIKQINPAKEQRLFEYFSKLGAETERKETVRGMMIVLKVPGRSPFYLRYG